MTKKQTAEGLLARMKRHWPAAFTSTAELMMRVYRLNEIILANAKRQTDKNGLSFTEFEVLAALRSAGPPYQLAPTELYSAILISSGGLTKVLDHLARQKLISRVPNPLDRRGLHVRLTPAGRRIIEKTTARVLATDDKLLSAGLTPAERAQLVALLRKLLMTIEPEAPP